MHPLQIEVFERLRAAKRPLRFSELCPKGIESDLYTYHLKQLMKLEYVQKLASGYELTKLGTAYLADIAPLRYGKPQLLKIAAMCLVVSEGKVLYQHRSRQPHAGSWLMVAGGLKRGELLLDAAKRRLNEEAGLNGDPGYVGTLRKIRLDPMSGKPWSDITYQVCLFQNPQGRVGLTKFGEHAWLTCEQAAHFEHTQIVGSDYLADYLQGFQKLNFVCPPPFYIEEVVTHDPF